MRHTDVMVFGEEKDVVQYTTTDGLRIGEIIVFLPFHSSKARSYLLRIQAAVDEALKAHPAPNALLDDLKTKEQAAKAKLVLAREEWDEAELALSEAEGRPPAKQFVYEVHRD